MSKIKDDIYSQAYLDHNRISERRKFSMADLSGRGKEANIEVNWNKLVRNKGFIKMSIGEEEVVLSREHLYAILFIIGSAAEQEKMISPFLKKTRVTKYQKLIGITASKDIKRGEFLNVPLEFTYNPENHQIVIGQGSVGVIKRRLENIKR